jgi:hypothetical protein
LNTREHGDTERGLNYQGKTPLDYQHTLFKNEGQEVKTGVFRRWVSVGGGGHMERVKEGEYGNV